MSLINNNQEDFPIYRIMSIYEFYDLYNHNKLKLTSYSKQEDKNDGLEKSIMFRLIDREELKEIHNNIRKTQYMTCWTKTRESIAMWSLYSPYKESILIKTTNNKLRKVLEIFKNDNPLSFERFSVKDYSIQNADYKNLFELVNNIDNGEKEDLLNISLNLSIGTRFLKDISYKHEDELRGVITVEYPLDKSCVYILDDDLFERLQQRKAIQPDIELLYNTKIDLPPILQAETSSDFIEEISFDPRIESYKKNALIKILKIRDESIITESNAFKSIIN